MTHPHTSNVSRARRSVAASVIDIEARPGASTASSSGSNRRRQGERQIRISLRRNRVAPSEAAAQGHALDLSSSHDITAAIRRSRRAAWCSPTTNLPGFTTVDHVPCLARKGGVVQDPEGNTLCIHEDIA